KTGEIEAQDAEPLCHQRASDPRRRNRVLAASEAVGEQRIGRNRAVGNIQPTGQRLVIGAYEIKGTGRHRSAPRLDRRRYSDADLRASITALGDDEIAICFSDSSPRGARFREGRELLTLTARNTDRDGS